MSNNAKNVSVGKPKVSGAIFVAPATETAPTDATTALSAKFNCVGYISDDGLKNKFKTSTSNIKAWGGDTVKVVKKSVDETFGFTMIEANEFSLKQAFGEDNVTVATDTGAIVIKHNALEKDEYIYVIEMLLTDDKVRRIVIPRGMMSELGDITYKDDEAVGYEVTIAAQSDASQNTAYEYIAKAVA